MHKKTAAHSSLQRLLTLFDKKDRLQAIALLILMIIGAGLEMAAVSLMFPLINAMTRADSTPSSYIETLLLKALPNSSPSELALSLLFLIVVFYVIKNSYFAALLFFQSRFGFAMQSKLSTTLFDCYLRLPYLFHLQRNTADLLRNLTHETDQIIWGLLFPTLALITEFLIALGLGLLLFYIQPVAAIVITGIFSTAGFIYYWIFRNKLERWTQLRMHHDSRRIRAIHEGLGGLKEVQILGRTHHFLAKYQLHNKERGQATAKQNMVIGSNLLLLEVLGMSCLLILAGINILQHNNLESVLPLMGVFAAAAFRLIPASNRIIINFQFIRSAKPVIETIAQALTEAENSSIQFKINEKENLTTSTLPFNKEIKLENIHFTYPDRTISVLENINLTIKKGQIIGITGPSGAGKTTLIDILLGVFPPQSGTVRVDGIDIQKKLPQWQRTIGYIPQDNYLVDGTIRDNVALGIPSELIDNESVLKALQDAQLKTLISTLPQGMYTPIGELGRELSGGQRQRIGIARALYHDPKVLVLDEATASLDSTTENEVLECIKKMQSTRTIIMITHRKSSLDMCDTIYRVTP